MRTLALVLLVVGIGWQAGCGSGAKDGDSPTRPIGQGGAEAGDADGVPDVPTILALEDPVERARGFLSLLEHLEPTKFGKVADQLQGRSDEWAEFEARLFVWAWSRVDPAAAMAAAVDWSPNLRDAVSYASARAWARRDPLAAREAVRLELEDRNERGNLENSLMSGLAHGWAENGDFEGALAFIDERFPSLIHRETLVEMLVQRMLEVKGIAQTFAWAESLAERHEDPAFLSIVFRKVGRNAIRKDPAATSAWLDRFEGDPSYMDRARRAAAVAWGREDPRAALAWMLAQPPANLRRVSGLTAILLDWVVREEAPALEWVRATPADPGLDEGVSGAARKIAERSPTEALVWVDLVRDPARREVALVSVLARWSTTDAKAASRYMKEHGLTADIEQQVATEAAAIPVRREQPNGSRPPSR